MIDTAPLVRVMTAEGKAQVIPADVLGITDPLDGVPRSLVDAFSRRMVIGSVTLLASASATGAGQAWPGGTGIWSISGTWGGATAQLQGSADSGATWTDVTGASTGVNTTPGQFIGDCPGSYTYRVALSGASGTTSLTSTLRTLDEA
jgi:hypothetical protein